LDDVDELVSVVGADFVFFGKSVQIDRILERGRLDLVGAVWIG
jgi:hypothetical protein